MHVSIILSNIYKPEKYLHKYPLTTLKFGSIAQPIQSRFFLELHL